MNSLDENPAINSSGSRLARLLLMLGACMCVLLTLTRTAAATVTTDEADYAPGSTAYITGSGFLAGETVQLQVLHTTTPNDDATSPAHQPWQVTADANGNFQTTWLVPPDEDELGATLEVTATGQFSGLKAQTRFTDGTVKINSAPSGVTFTLVRTVYTAAVNCTGAVQSGYPKTSTVNNSGINDGVGNNQSIKLQAAATSDQGGNFINWTSPDSSPFSFVDAV